MWSEEYFQNPALVSLQAFISMWLSERMRATRVNAPSKLMILPKCKQYSIYGTQATPVILVPWKNIFLLASYKTAPLTPAQNTQLGERQQASRAHAHSWCICLFNFILFFQNPLTISIFPISHSPFAESAAHAPEERTAQEWEMCFWNLNLFFFFYAMTTLELSRVKARIVRLLSPDILNELLMTTLGNDHVSNVIQIIGPKLFLLTNALVFRLDTILPSTCLPHWRVWMLRCAEKYKG